MLELPNKREHVVTIELMTVELSAYCKMETGLAHMVGGMTEEEFERNRVGIFGRLTKLRQLATSMLAVDTSFPCVPSKIAMATKVVCGLVGEGHRVVVHTLLVDGVIGPLVRELGLRGICCAVLTGSVPAANRQGIIDGFVNGVAQVLVISAAGTEGLNLQRGTDRKVLLTPWWNYAVTSQAIDRIHRLG